MSNMEGRHCIHPEDAKHYTTERLRKEFLIDNLMQQGKINGVYSHYDRMITIGAVPTSSPLSLPAFEEFTKQDFFLARRELGVINVGGTGTVKVDGESFTMENKDCLYIGLGKKDVAFESNDANNPAVYYINSCPAHKEHPTTRAAKAEANPVEMGAKETSNERTIFQYIHQNGIQSCQLVMGFTELKTGSVWNTFPPHKHDRRMEAYFYFDLDEDQRICHLMGEPEETRHLFIANHQAVISPSWSIHSGAGTSSYSFIWAMAGENMDFTDMDGISMERLK